MLLTIICFILEIFKICIRYQLYRGLKGTPIHITKWDLTGFRFLLAYSFLCLKLNRICLIVNSWTNSFQQITFHLPITLSFSPLFNNTSHLNTFFTYFHVNIIKWSAQVWEVDDTNWCYRLFWLNNNKDKEVYSLLWMLK